MKASCIARAQYAPNIPAEPHPAKNASPPWRLHHFRHELIEVCERYAFFARGSLDRDRLVPSATVQAH